MVTRSIYRIIEETAPLIILYSVIGLITGGILWGMTSEIELLPGLLILVPPLLDMRGGIGSTLGARLSSALHLGYVKTNRTTKCLKVNVYSSVVLSLFMSVILGAFAWASCMLMGMMCVGFASFLIIAVIAGFSSGIVMTFLAIFIVRFSYKRGLDPDDVTAPSIGTIGDMITIACLFLTVKLVVLVGLI
jgi:mgtE-like transporter